MQNSGSICVFKLSYGMGYEWIDLADGLIVVGFDVNQSKEFIIIYKYS